jgi:hypothetical protein
MVRSSLPVASGDLILALHQSANELQPETPRKFVVLECVGRKAATVTIARKIAIKSLKTYSVQACLVLRGGPSSTILKSYLAGLKGEISNSPESPKGSGAKRPGTSAAPRSAYGA